MPPDESKSNGANERLWDLIQARETGERTASSGCARAASNGEGPHADAPLICALYNVLREDEMASSEGAPARARLFAEINAARTAPAVPRVPKRAGFFSVPGRGRWALAAALLLITVTALAFLYQSINSRICEPDAPPSPPKMSALPSIPPGAPSPGTGRANRDRSP
jgi:hypothetical protein